MERGARRNWFDGNGEAYSSMGINNPTRVYNPDRLVYEELLHDMKDGFSIIDTTPTKMGRPKKDPHYEDRSDSEGN